VLYGAGSRFDMYIDKLHKPLQNFEKSLNNRTKRKQCTNYRLKSNEIRAFQRKIRKNRTLLSICAENDSNFLKWRYCQAFPPPTLRAREPHPSARHVASPESTIIGMQKSHGQNREKYMPKTRQKRRCG